MSNKNLREQLEKCKSLEQAAKILFINDTTLKNWLQNNPHYASLYLVINNKKVPFFSDDDIEKIKKDKNLKDHNENTILKDFIDFIDEDDHTLSYKLPFLINMFDLADKDGDVDFNVLTDNYRLFYLDRIDRNLPVDRKTCPYTIDFLNDLKKVKKSILDNPFEKFSRKNFLYQKDVNTLSFNPTLWNQLTNDLKKRLRDKEEKFLEEYYKDLGGL